MKSGITATGRVCSCAVWNLITVLESWPHGQLSIFMKQPFILYVCFTYGSVACIWANELGPLCFGSEKCLVKYVSESIGIANLRVWGGVSSLFVSCISANRWGTTFRLSCGPVAISWLFVIHRIWDWVPFWNSIPSNRSRIPFRVYTKQYSVGGVRGEIMG
jgi:hypothetical protein